MIRELNQAKAALSRVMGDLGHQKPAAWVDGKWQGLAPGAIHCYGNCPVCLTTFEFLWCEKTGSWSAWANLFEPNVCSPPGTGLRVGHLARKKRLIEAEVDMARLADVAWTGAVRRPATGGPISRDVMQRMFAGIDMGAESMSIGTITGRLSSDRPPAANAPRSRFTDPHDWYHISIPMDFSDVEARVIAQAGSENVVGRVHDSFVVQVPSDPQERAEFIRRLSSAADRSQNLIVDSGNTIEFPGVQSRAQAERLARFIAASRAAEHAEISAVIDRMGPSNPVEPGPIPMVTGVYHPGPRMAPPDPPIFPGVILPDEPIIPANPVAPFRELILSGSSMGRLEGPPLNVQQVARTQQHVAMPAVRRERPWDYRAAARNNAEIMREWRARQPAMERLHHQVREYMEGALVRVAEDTIMRETRPGGALSMGLTEEE